MALEIVREEPTLDSFTSLEEHQSQTPGQFYGGKPVLHHYTSNAQLLIGETQLDAQPAFAVLRKPGADPATVSAINGGANGHRHSETVTVPHIDVWVTSERLILFSTHTRSGVSIPYPNISLHAIQRLSAPVSTAPVADQQGLYMQLTLNDTETINSEEDIETVEITLIPTTTSTVEEAAITSVPNPTASATSEATPPLVRELRATESTSPIRALFAAVSACADLHPDPATGSDEEGDPQTAMPGAGGWITSENMHEFFDEDGQFVGGGTLGGGAGTVRGRDEEDEGPEAVMDEEGEETKWRRTE
ncbi:hypothetical protein W97_08638 [Coniosporium apollinis CBS 100218]|uniref:Regulator of volume decrease after cellular swelling-domain-containing protein n=1 Tax=Coniosporium apollinis (strain CBS 100218) TaxID=1168221 RepID=R7Z5J4_CONA1|nr:uncharacterized protein W97_08638 [Coniosporium apollinis CBS 100218]EON69378.1 hypothetical protein W97_08638 [Coniosporium apollinis CBS 100218]